MSQTELVVDTLKQVIREHGTSYRELGAAIGVSESTIKRAFSKQSFNLRRLEQICGALGITLLELTQRARHHHETESYQLSLSQERRLVTDIKFFMFFWLLVNRQRLGVITRRFRLSRADVDRYLSRLDQMNIIELREKQRFTLKVPRNVVWNHNGPIERRIVYKSMARFLRGNFARDNEHRRFIVARLSPLSLELFRARLAELIEDVFQQSVTLDATLPDAVSVGVLGAIGPLDFSLRDVIDRAS